MGKEKRVTGTPMQHLRAWRESLKLSRQYVADQIGSLTGITPDQATVAKWESGSVRVEDLELLARVYGTRADRLFFPPGDEWTPEALRRAHEVLTRLPRDKAARWLEMGADLAPAATPSPHDKSATSRF